MNPFFKKFETPFETIPFHEIKNEHYLPALKEAIASGKNEIESIATNKDLPSFENTIEALDSAGSLVDIVSGVFFNLNVAETNDEMQEIAKELSPTITEYSNDILLDARLFAKIKEIYDDKENLDLNIEQTTLLEKTYKSFVRNGALLDEEKKNQVREIDKKMSKLQLEFGENVLKETNKFEMVIENKDELEGLPESIIEAASMAAKEKGKEGKWVFTLDYPSYGPFMTYSSNRNRREEIFRASTSKANKGDELDNKEIVHEIVKLRHERANILGYSTHADFVLEERMASKPGKVMGFLDDLYKHSFETGKKEVAELQEYANSLGGPETLQSWDCAYYAEKLKKERFNIDDEILKPYFKLENVVKGVFEVATKLYGLTFIERDDIPKYHEDVKTYEVRDENGNYTSVFYADFFPRTGKQNGAWMTSFRDQFKTKEGNDHRPHISIVCNFTKPTESKPSLLTFNEVTTLFHEFGHALHGMLANTTYRTLSGTNVYWDFVELPSQILENWAYEKECLDLFATHYETGEAIPLELITKIKESSNFHEGLATVRQLSFGFLDMAWHSSDPSTIDNVVSFEEKAMDKTRILPKVEGVSMSCAFGHIFRGGYSAGYYSYKWAEVLDADAFEHFKNNGIFNRDIASSFKDNILSKGGSEHPMDLYKRFRGSEPSVEPLLKRGGLI